MFDKRRITTLQKSPCIKCKVSNQCDVRLAKDERLMDIKNMMYERNDKALEDCGIYVGLTCSELVDES